MRDIFSTGSLHTYSIDPCFDFAARAGSDGIGIRADNRWDITHLGPWHLEHVDSYVRWQEQVRYIHLSNFNVCKHRKPEDGYLRLDVLAARLVADGYGGAISFKLRPDPLRAGTPGDVIVELMTNRFVACRTGVNSVAADQQEIDYSHPAHALF